MRRRRKDRRRWFWTQYPSLGTVSYVSRVRAISRRAARALVARRGLHETIIGSGATREVDLERLFNECLRAGKLTQAMRWELLHGAVWLCYLGVKSGVMTVDEALSDEGLTHSLVHCFGGVSRRGSRDHRNYMGCARRLIRDVSAKIPGYR